MAEDLCQYSTILIPFLFPFFFTRHGSACKNSIRKDMGKDKIQMFSLSALRDKEVSIEPKELQEV